MSEKGDKAEQLFKEGYNCSQAVIGAFADEIGMDFETAVRLASSFGGGMGRMREVCGTVSAIFMIAGLKMGYSDPKAPQEKKEHYARIMHLAEEFKQENGSIVCRELLGIDNNGNPTPEARTASYYKKRPCAELVRQAAEIIEKELEDAKTAKAPEDETGR